MNVLFMSLSFYVFASLSQAYVKINMTLSFFKKGGRKYIFYRKGQKFATLSGLLI